MKTALDLCRICAWALPGEKPDPAELAGMDFLAVWRLAAMQRMEALVAHVALSVSGFGSDAARAAWKQVCDHALFQMLAMDTERGVLFEFMEREGIWHMPLKGLILRTLYPKPELRQMCDNDILFDSAAAGKLHRFMTSRGYRAEDGWLYDRSYKKEPCFHFELHKTLLSPLSGAAELYPHYKNVHERLLHVPGTRCEMTFRDEDFYLYLLVHARKHDLEWEAIGLRMALDLKLYLDQKEPALDWRYIDRQLDLMRMRDFAGDLRNLAMRLFSPSGIQELNADGTAMLERLAGSDIYGHDKAARERSIARQLQRAESGRVRFPKLTYMMARLFPPARQMREIFSPCQKWPFLLPLAYLLRFGTCLRQSRRFLREVKQVITSRG